MSVHPFGVDRALTCAMRIAFVHNLQTADTEDQAEFDRPETVAALTGSLRNLGHEVLPVNLTASFAEAARLLERWQPDLVFNTAEGWRGPLREALVPALLDELDLAYTGSDAATCALTLDKQRTKAIVEAAGVRVAWGTLVRTTHELETLEAQLPAIVKPNFEGSSKGIDARSVVHDRDALIEVVGSLLRRFPEGVLVEAFIPGRDVTVPWLEAVPGGVLPPAEYRFRGSSDAGPTVIYDFALKQEGAAVEVCVPAHLRASSAAEIETMTRAVAQTLGLRDFARMDFRVGLDDKVWFLEVNALPSLEEGASLFESASCLGLDTPEAVLSTILESAARRVAPTIAARPPRLVRVGLIHNLRRVDPSSGDDSEAEYDSPKTIQAVREAIEALGAEVVALEADRDLPTTLQAAGIDFAFNLAEGRGGRGREGQVPALLDLLGIPYAGSDATTMGITLDKGLAKAVVTAAGVLTPPSAVFRSGDEPIPRGLEFPMFIKPIAEGSSKGIDAGSVVHDEASLRERVRWILRRYHQPALVEAFLPGREFTVGVLEDDDSVVLPPMEICHRGDETSVYGFDDKLATSDAIRYVVPARVSQDLLDQLERTARDAFHALGCRDFARFDFRLDVHGRVNFIECNPLPGLSPGWSDLCLVAEAAGLTHAMLVAVILVPAMRRAGLTPGAHFEVPRVRTS